jgi:hypothetical protein
MKSLRTALWVASFSFGLAAAGRSASADVCFSGHHEPTDDANPGTMDAGSDGILGLGLGKKGGGHARQAGTGLILVAGLGLAWLGSRRRDDDGPGSC